MPKKSKQKVKQKHKAALICPACKSKWAILHYDYESVIDESNFEILIKKIPLTTEKKELRCTNCGYIYKNIDIFRDIINENFN